MSGIIGIIHRDGAPVHEELVRRITASMAYRGPDAQQTWASGSVGFGHAMLQTTWESEQDQQPLVRDGLVVIADARIDGRAELIRDLRGKASQLQDAADSELILGAYERWGERCIEHLIGDFAFAIWDQPNRRLFCARDHMGIKPFYYAEVGETLIFSNDIKSLRQYPTLRQTLNGQAVAHFILFGHNREVSSTTFSAIRRLPPAHTLTVRAGQTMLSRYWMLPVDGCIRFRRSEEYVENFRAHLQTAVQDRMRADRVSLLMSGGLDSTAVAGLGVRAAAQQRRSTLFQAHTVIEEILAPDEERHYSEIAANHLGLEICYSCFDAYSAFERFDDQTLQTPEPHGNVFVAATFDFYKRAAAWSRVGLSGTGGDPLLHANCGRIEQWNRMGLIKTFAVLAIAHRRIPRLGFRTTLRRISGNAAVTPELPRWCNEATVMKYDLRETWHCSGANTSGHPIRPEAHAALSSPIWSNVFEQDFGAARCSFEIRYPFFDVRLLTYALALPPLPWFVEKHLLRRATKRLLPAAVRLRPKTVVRHSQFEARRRQIHDQLRTFSPSRTLLQYVDWSKLVSDIEKTPETTLLAALRCMCFDRWLRASGAVS